MDKNRLLAAGKELIRGNFGQAVKSLTYERSLPINSATYGTNATYFWGADGTQVHFSYDDRNSSLNAFQNCSPLTNIIIRKSQAYINGKTWVMNTQGKESQTPQAKSLRRLFEKPNPLQSWRQFEAQGYIYQQLFGFNIVLPIIPAGFSDAVDASSMWNIPPFMLDIEETDKLFYQTNVAGIIKSVKLNYKGRSQALDVEKLWFFKDFVPSMCSMVFPESRVCSLKNSISNIIGAMESRGELINYRGARGIMTPSGKDQIGNQILTKAEKDEIHKEHRMYGLRRGQSQFIISSTQLNWQGIGQPTKELMLFEEIEDDTMQICDAYGYPYRLLSQEKAASYNDVKEFKKLLYQDTIMGESDSNYEQWNQLFRTSEHNINLQKDYSHLAVLQEDAQKKAQALNTTIEGGLKAFYANMITYNRLLEWMNEDTRPGYDKYYSDLLSEGMIFTLPQIQQNGTGQTANTAATGTAA